MLNDLTYLTRGMIWGFATAKFIDRELGDEYRGGWVFYVNAEKGVTVVRNEATQQKCVIRTADGDKFDVYTGICIGMFKLLTGIPYWRMNRMIEQFALVDSDHDPTAKFMCEYVHDLLGIDRKFIEEEYALACEEAKGKKTVVFGCVSKALSGSSD